MLLFNAFIHFLFLLTIGFYLITTLQWFSYKFERIIFHFTKPFWHIWFLVIPILLHFILHFVAYGDEIFAIYFLAIYLPSAILWHKKLDKKLVLTNRVKQFFIILSLISLIVVMLCFIIKAKIMPVFIPLFFAFSISFFIENFKFNKFKNLALQKLNKIENLIIIEITASYGKTSIKNFLYQILSQNYKCYKTPRSINTLGGIIKDINDNLPLDTQIYIAEAGARINGDIKEITEFLNPQIVIVGEIGAQHIEYFKNIENIRKTKLEALQSNRLKHAFLHSSTQVENSENITIYDENLQILDENLDGIKFEIYENTNLKTEFFAPILGSFNATNLSACIKVAQFLNLQNLQDIVSKIKSVEHRLQKIENGGKIIIDDSFNGNLNGMLKSYELVKKYNGRKVIITPGIVESTKEDNEKIAEKINEIFDLVMITGGLNLQILQSKIKTDKTIIIKDKKTLTENLSKYTMKGDLILFSNDAPNFI